MFVTTNENGKLRMPPLRTRAEQHDDEVDSSANGNPPAASSLIPTSSGGGPFASQADPQAKPMVPRRTLPHSGTGHPLVNPATQSFVGHIQNASNTLPEPLVPVIPIVSVASTSVP